MSRAIGIKGRGIEMYSVLLGRAEGIILPEREHEKLVYTIQSNFLFKMSS